MNAATPTIRNLALVGFMGTGKSTVGHHVADDLRFTFLDTDELLEKRADKPIARIFAEDGEPVFRQLESDLVRDLETKTNCVIATGGGLIVNPANLASLKKHALVICLWASPEAIWHLWVEDFMAIVTMDAHGESLHQKVFEESKQRLAALKA